MAVFRTQLGRRQLLKSGLAAAAAPMIIPSSALGLDGALPPSERIVVGGIGIGRRGEYDLSCFLTQPDVRVRSRLRREGRTAATAVKKIADTQSWRRSTAAQYRDFRELLDRKDIDAVLIATGPELAWHRRDAFAAKRRQRHLLREALHENHSARASCSATRCGGLRHRLPGGHAAAQPSALRLRVRTGPHRPARENSSGSSRIPMGMTGLHAAAGCPAETPPDPAIDRLGDRYLGPAAWRPFNAKTLLDGFNFEKGGGLVGGGVLEWGSHCVDLCQWAVGDYRLRRWNTTRPERRPAHRQRYANGVELDLP
jgi:hypothetical protein